MERDENSKQVRSFVFTFNNYDDNSVSQIKEKFADARYGVIGYETGEKGTPHLQGYIQLRKRKILGNVKKSFKWWADKVRGDPSQAATYCKKSGDFIEWGQMADADSGTKAQKDKWELIVSLAKTNQLEKVCEEFPSEYVRLLGNLSRVRTEHLTFNNVDDRKSVWLHGKPGTGKSRFAFNEFLDFYPKNANKWWDGYKDQEVVILDDLGKTHDVLGYHLKRWTDRYACIGEIKGGSIPLNYKNFIVTSNYTIEEIWNDPEMQAALNRRFRSIHVTGLCENVLGYLELRSFDNFFHRNNIF